MTTATISPPAPATTEPAASPNRRDRPSVLGTAVLLLGALYCLIPVIWVLTAATKSRGELFTTFTYAPSTHLWSNILDLSAYRDGLFWRWMLNTALYAGVGAVLSTVDSPEALTAVTRAIKATGYSANHAARSLALGRSNSVAFLLTEPQHLLFEDPTFSRLMGGCTQALAQHDMLLTLVTAGTAGDRKRAVEYVAGRHVDGVLLVSGRAGNSITDDLLAAGVPTVVCGRFPGLESRLSMVGADDLDGGRRMTEHLISRGSTRVTTITGPLDTPGGTGRLEATSEPSRLPGCENSSAMATTRRPAVLPRCTTC